MLRVQVVVLIVMSCIARLGGQEVDEWNVPPEMSGCLDKMPALSIRTEINPFYLSGDFDGDGRLDYAIQVVEGKTLKKGVLVCLSSIKGARVIGAGHNFGGEESLRFDAWYVLSRAALRRSIGASARGDACVLRVKETASGIVYWDGRGFRWKQLDD